MGLQLHAGPAVSFNHSGHQLISLELINFAFGNIQTETYWAVRVYLQNLPEFSTMIYDETWVLLLMGG